MTPDAQALLAELDARGVRLEAHGGKLRFFPRDRVTVDLLDALRAHKGEILTILARGTQDKQDDLAEALAALTGDERAHYDAQLAARADAGEPSPGIEWRALVDVWLHFGHWPTPRTGEAPRASWRRLVGAGFPSHPAEAPDPRILADPVTMCPRCDQVRVLPELAGMTGGTCWGCWTATNPDDDTRP